MTPAARRAAGAALLLAAVLLAYLPALGNGFVWEDDEHVTGNRTLRSVEGLRRIWLEPRATPQYYPLVHTSFWIERRIWGDSPLGYHFVNVLLHAANALLAWRLLALLGVPGAWLAAALFGLHPVHVESVAWVTERKNVLSGLFYLASAAAALEWTGLRLGADARRRRRAYALSLALFAAALLSKTVTATLPAAVLVAVWWRRGRVPWRTAAALLPFFALGAVSGAGTAWLERAHVGATGAAWDLSLPDRLVVAGRALWFYLAKLAWPAKLAFFYPRWEPGAGGAWRLLFPAAAGAAGAALWLLRVRIGRGPVAAAAFFALSLGPALGFVNVYPMRFSFVADHFQYLASLGPLALAAAGAQRAAGRLRLAAALRLPAAAALLGLLGALTWRQCAVYRNDETLWRDVIAKNPRAWEAYTNLGSELERQGRHGEALELYVAVLRVRPDDPVTWYNLGGLYARFGRIEEALAGLRRAIELNPQFTLPYFRIGEVLRETAGPDAAIAHYRAVLARSPRWPDGNYRLGLLLAEKGDRAGAEAAFRLALAEDPAHAPAWQRLGRLLDESGRGAEAIDALRAAVRSDPLSADPRLGLGALLERAGRTEEARRAFAAALRLEPENPAARRALEHTDAGGRGAAGR